MTIYEWLNRINLIKYYPLFRTNNIFFLTEMKNIDPDSDEYNNLEIQATDR